MANMLTERQQQVLDFINDSIRFRGYPPTFREIGEKMGIKSTNGVNDHLKALEKKGFLHRDDLKSRALRPLQANSAPANTQMFIANEVVEAVVSVPVVGRCAAGAPILATEHIEETIRVDRFFLGSHREVFALRVKGDSMIEAGIFDGDYVFVRKQAVAQTGEIVVAMINDEATIKYFYPDEEKIIFKPANHTLKPIVVHKSEFKPVNVLGTVVGVYRKFS